MKVFSQLDPPAHEPEVCSTKDLGVLDKVSITKVTDFMQKFQDDATFTPPTVDVLFDTDNFENISIDDDAEIDSLFIDIEDMDEDVQRARAKS